MANNVYGTVKPAMFDPISDVDIYYYYKPSRSSESNSFLSFKKIDSPSSILSRAEIDLTDEFNENFIPGMYTLKLPASIFGNKGIYTIYITPRGINCSIKDIGALAAYPDVRGIVIDMNTIPDYRTLFGDDNLTGYRIEYKDYDPKTGQSTLQEYFRIITSNGFVEPVSQNLTSGNTNSNGYRYNASGSLAFLTVTPSTAPSFKSNANPYIGVPNQQIIIRNTKFDPVCIEVEVTEHDIETISYMLEGEQIRNLENGRVTTYNFDGEIYKQFQYSTVKDNYHAKNIAEAKLDKSDNIDRSLNLEEIRNA